MNKHSFTPRSTAETLTRICEKRGGDLWDSRRKAPHQANLAKLLGVSQPNIFRWLVEGRTITDQKIKQVAERLKITPSQARGEVPIPEIDGLDVKEKPPSIYCQGLPAGEMYVSSAPLITRDQVALMGDKDYHDLIPGGAIDYIPCREELKEGSFAFEVEHDETLINGANGLSVPAGSVVIVDPSKKSTDGKLVATRSRTTGKISLKRIVTDGETMYLAPINPDYKPRESGSDTLILGVVAKIEITP